MESERNSMMEPAREREKLCRSCHLRVARSIKKCPNCKSADFIPVRDDNYLATEKKDR